MKSHKPANFHRYFGMVFCDDIIEVKYENGYKREEGIVKGDFKKLKKKISNVL